MGRVVLRSRRGTEILPAFPEMGAGAVQLPDATTLDGELLGWLEAFEDGDGPGDRGGNDPAGRNSMGVFALESETTQPVAVDAAVWIALDAQAAALQVLDYWCRGVIPTMRNPRPRRMCQRASRDRGLTPPRTSARADERA